MQVNDGQPSRSFKPGACKRCGGDAFLDKRDGVEWRCLQCGRPLMSYFLAQVEVINLRAGANLQAADGRGVGYQAMRTIV